MMVLNYLEIDQDYENEIKKQEKQALQQARYR